MAESKVLDQPKVKTPMEILADIKGKYKVTVHQKTWISDALDKNHDGASMFSKSKYLYQVPWSNSGGLYKTGIESEEQRKAFETIMNRAPNTFSPYPQYDDKGKPRQSFWSSVDNEISLITIPKDGLTLDCDNHVPDKLKFLMLKASVTTDPNSGDENGMVSTSTDKAMRNPSCIILITSEEAESKSEGDKVAIKMKAFMKLGAMDQTEKRDFFKIYKYKNTQYKAGDLTKDNLVNSKIMEIADKDPSAFLEVVEDPNFKDLVLLENLIHFQIVKSSGGRILTHDGDLIGNTKAEAVNNLHTPDFQDLKIALLSRLETVTKK